MERTRGETQETSVYAANLAAVLASQGRHSEAVGHYRRALTILHGLGREHDTFKSAFPVLAEGLARSLNELGRNEEARDLVAQAEAIRDGKTRSDLGWRPAKF